MILTDETLEAFQEYLYNTNKENLIDDFESIDVVIKNALIIDFFDSVGIYIEIRRNNNNPLNKGFRGYVVKRINSYHQCTSIPKSNRQEATTEAIKKANDIYNETI